MYSLTILRHLLGTLCNSTSYLCILCTHKIIYRKKIYTVIVDPSLYTTSEFKTYYLALPRDLHVPVWREKKMGVKDERMRG